MRYRRNKRRFSKRSRGYKKRGRRTSSKYILGARGGIRL